MTTELKELLDWSDKQLGYEKPPDLEIIFVKSFITRHIPFTERKYGICSNMFGHICLRYTYEGKQYVTNIHPNGNSKTGGMIEAYSPEEYIFDLANVTPQKGVNNREMFGLRYYDVSREQIGIIHNYLMFLSKNEGTMFKFSGGPDILLNFAKRLGVVNTLERGNCALWTSKALKLAHITDSISTFPKKIIVNAFEKNTPKTYMVHYKAEEDSKRDYGKDGKPIELVNLTLTTSILYGRMEKFCDATIELPYKKHNYEPHKLVNINCNPVKQNALRYRASCISTYVVPATVCYIGYKNRDSIKTSGMTLISNLRKFFRK